MTQIHLDDVLNLRLLMSGIRSRFGGGEKVFMKDACIDLKKLSFPFWNMATDKRI